MLNYLFYSKYLYIFHQNSHLTYIYIYSNKKKKTYYKGENAISGAVGISLFLS